MTISSKELGRAIAEVRRLRGLTQKAVSERSGLTINYLSLVENGERNVSFDALNKIAEALRVPAGWLTFLGGDTPAGPLAGEEFAELHEATRETLRAAIQADQTAEV